jgi:trimeric autotransporter adhesin
MEDPAARPRVPVLASELQSMVSQELLQRADRLRRHRQPDGRPRGVAPQAASSSSCSSSSGHHAESSRAHVRRASAADAVVSRDAAASSSSSLVVYAPGVPGRELHACLQQQPREVLGRSRSDGAALAAVREHCQDAAGVCCDESGLAGAYMAATGAGAAAKHTAAAAAAAAAANEAAAAAAAVASSACGAEKSVAAFQQLKLIMPSSASFAASASGLSPHQQHLKQAASAAADPLSLRSSFTSFQSAASIDSAGLSLALAVPGLALSALGSSIRQELPAEGGTSSPAGPAVVERTASGASSAAGLVTPLARPGPKVVPRRSTMGVIPADTPGAAATTAVAAGALSANEDAAAAAAGGGAAACKDTAAAGGGGAGSGCDGDYGCGAHSGSRAAGACSGGQCIQAAGGADVSADVSTDVSATAPGRQQPGSVQSALVRARSGGITRRVSFLDPPTLTE